MKTKVEYYGCQWKPVHGEARSKMGYEYEAPFAEIVTRVIFLESFLFIATTRELLCLN